MGTKRKPKQKSTRVWLGQFKTTAAASGSEAQKGYGRPRRKWDQLPAIEREARANFTYPDHRNTPLK